MSPAKKSSTPCLDRLESLDDAAVAAAGRVREVEDEQRKAAADLARISEELTEAFAAGDRKAAERLGRAKATAHANAAQPWAEMVAGAKRAADRARADRDGYIIERHADLVAERAPGAVAAAEGVRNAIVALREAVRGWQPGA
jgi:hypothetical protein